MEQQHRDDNAWLMIESPAESPLRDRLFPVQLLVHLLHLPFLCLCDAASFHHAGGRQRPRRQMDRLDQMQ